MALKISSLSFACVAIRDFLRDNMAGIPQELTVEIGAPGEVDPEGTANVLNLFFYRFDPSGFGPISRPDETFRIRAYCLISAFGVAAENISAGENELRMLGEVMRLFHENPILEESEFVLAGQTSGERFRIQAVYFQMAEEQLSQFWSANGDTGIRPSLAYEFSLLPIVPEKKRIDPPRVGALGTETRADMQRRRAPPTVTPSGPSVAATRIDVDDPSWQPRICWVVANRCHLTLALTTAQAAAFVPKVWIAGDPAVDVELVWEVWKADTGWTEAGATVTARPFSTEIDPEAVPSAAGTFPASVPFPSSLPGGTAGQVVLYARRSVAPPSGGPPQILRSNPLLISIYSDS